jgi:septal ring factor EnvC (AmiA/AmiB activator)
VRDKGRYARAGLVAGALLVAAPACICFAQSAPAGPTAAPAPATTPPVPLSVVPGVAVPSATAPAAASGSAVDPNAITDVNAAEAAAAANQKALDALAATINLSKDKTDALKQEIAAMHGDQAKQDAALIAAGQRVRIAQIEVQSMQERLTDLATAEQDVRTRLDGADASVSSMLAALEQISLNPPPALIVDPSDAVGSARSAILISAVLPQLRAKADEVVADLKHLESIKADAEGEQTQLNANYAVLQEEQLRIATLIQARKQTLASAGSQLNAQEQEALGMAQQADALRQQIARLNAKANALKQAALVASAHPDLPTQTPAAIRTALANTARTAPAIPFESARGYLTQPVAGQDIEDFGADDGLGGIAEGISYQTAPNAKVVAPADGWVVYKGPYLNYGQIVILNPGDGYTIVLAGLQDISVNLGQFLLEGEPLGTMGSHTIGRIVAAGAGVSQPTLYIELRKNDQPLDPTGWWAAPSNTTQSG